MNQSGSTGRRFNLRDTLILVAAVALGLGLSNALNYAQSRTTVPSSPIVQKRDWLGSSFLLILAAHMGVLVSAILPPRIRLRRLSRQPGFLAGISVAFWFAFNTASMAYGWASTPGLRSARDPLKRHLNNYLLTVSSPYHVAPIILLAWAIGAMHGFRHARRDWTESLGRLMGCAWLGYWLVLVVIVRWLW